MPSLYTTTTLHLNDTPIRVVVHCVHDDHTASYRVEHDGPCPLYLCGTVEQLRAVGEAIIRTADDTAVARQLLRESEGTALPPDVEDQAQAREASAR
jgi:hypothetical protein